MPRGKRIAAKQPSKQGKRPPTKSGKGAGRVSIRSKKSIKPKGK